MGGLEVSVVHHLPALTSLGNETRARVARLGNGCHVNYSTRAMPPDENQRTNVTASWTAVSASS